MEEIKLFAHGVLAQWIVLMSGLVALIVDWSVLKRKKPVSVVSYLIICACTLLVASFFVWRSEHRELASVRTDLQTTKTNLDFEKSKRYPDLEGRVDRFLVGSTSNPNETFALVQMSIRNLGTYPSVVEDFALHGEWNKVSLDGQPVFTSEEGVFEYVERMRTNRLHHSDCLDEKASKAIEPGARVQGWLAFHYPGINTDSAGWTNRYWIVAFADVKGKTISVTNNTKTNAISNCRILPQ